MSEHTLIENHNHTSDRLPTPDESLPRIVGDRDEQLQASKHYEDQIKETIRGLDRKRMQFNRKGTVTLQMELDGEMKDIELKIRAIPDRILEQIEEPIHELQGLIPQRWEKEATWNADDKLWEPGYVQDLSDPEFPAIHRKSIKAIRQMNYEKAIYGLAEPFWDGHTIIWDSTQAYKYNKNDIHNVGEAIEYLQDMGISYEQITHIASEVSKLSAQAVVTDKEEFTKKQEQPSEPHTG